MSEFDLDFNWNVGKAAEKLNVSLFGGEKKKKQGVIFPPEKQNVPSAVVQDSDDEMYTKRGKRKLKKKIGKLKRKHVGDVNEMQSEFEEKQNVNVFRSSPSLTKAQKMSESSNTMSKEQNSKKRKVAEDYSSLKKKSTKKRKVSTSEPDQTKRKHMNGKSSSTGIESQNHLGKKGEKNLRENQNVTEEKEVEGEGGNVSRGAKRKRNRKKKNNPNKNKYRHLALNPMAKSELGHQNSESRRESVPFSQNSHETQPEKTSSKDKKSSVSEEKTQSQQKKRKKNTQKPEDSLDRRQSVPKDISNMEDHTKKSGKKKRKLEKLSTNGSNQSGDGVQEMEGAVKLRKLDFFSKTESSIPKGDKSKSKKVDNDVTGKLLSESKSSSKKVKKKGDRQMDAIALRKDKTSAASIENGDNNDEKTSVGKPSPFSSIWGKAAGLVEQAKETLNSARFRFLNEQLYTCTGHEAMDIFKHDKDAFQVYHEGFQGQVSKWEVNPLDVIIRQIKDKPRSLTVADFGCGEGRLAQSIPQKVHSFDLVSLNKNVIACDMAKVPLSTESVDIAVFCLALMGTNLNNYIAEANRVLKTGGLLKVAEVVSRFSGLSPFITAVCAHGFTLLNKRDLTQMFYLMDFKKTKSVKKSSVTATIKLKPCIYKRR